MALSPTQAAIIAAALQHPDRLVVPPRLPPAPREAIRKSFLAKGLIEPVAIDGADPAAAWSTDTGPAHFRITDIGQAAIGAETERRAVDDPVRGELAAEEAEQELAQEPLNAGIDLTAPDAPAQAAAGGLLPAAAATAAAGAPAAGAGSTGSTTGEASQDAPQAPVGAGPEPHGRHTLRTAAMALLGSWDAGPGRPRLEEAVEALRRALAGKADDRPGLPRMAGAPRTPREGTKQERVLALLRRPEGATVAQIVEATGWQRHTVRGLFAGLKKRQGIVVTAAERVRQVGTDGVKGSYTIYRITDAG
jgi:hypothetical protein